MSKKRKKMPRVHQSGQTREMTVAEYVRSNGGKPEGNSYVLHKGQVAIQASSSNSPFGQ